jgi:hypothetical protein
MANTLAYGGTEIIAALEGFMIQAPGNIHFVMPYSLNIVAAVLKHALSVF